jgi:lipopolysaccharide transport system permease protein
MEFMQSVKPLPYGAPAALPVTRIRPSQGWVSLGLGELWEYRELLYFLTWRDIKVRYKQTVLGAAWAIFIVKEEDHA